MKKQTLSLVAVVLLSAQYLYAQTPHIEPEKWIDNPGIRKLDNKYSKESAVGLFDRKAVEFVDEPKDEMAEYYTLHKIVHINDDRGIEYYNQRYLGITENADIVEIRG